MGQVAIYLSSSLQELLDQAAHEEGVSRSAWVQEAVEEKLTRKSFDEDWFALWGSWEDKRSVSEILKDLDQGYQEKERTPIR
jgi:predicted transcriptional regulator